MYMFIRGLILHTYNAWVITRDRQLGRLGGSLLFNVVVVIIVDDDDDVDSCYFMMWLYLLVFVMIGHTYTQHTLCTDIFFNGL